MASIDPHSPLHAVYGSLDGLVFRRHRGRVVCYRKPRFVQPRTGAQLVTQGRFGGGSAYARRVAAEASGLLAQYRERGKPRGLNYRQMAIRDFFHPPVVQELLADDFHPVTGGPLRVWARDDFEVVSVGVCVRDRAGQVVAEGPAQCDAPAWRFTVPARPAEAEPAATVEVTACDHPGNRTVRVFTV